jgi:hypothetical protein
VTFSNTHIGNTEKRKEQTATADLYVEHDYANKQQALVSLIRLQALGVSDMEIKNMAQLIDLSSMWRE